MLGNLFNSPSQLIILVLVIVLLFGATRLPNAARQVGRSMRIFKSEVKQMKDDDAGTQASTSSRTPDDEDVDPAPQPLEGKVIREDHAPRTTQPGSSDGARRDT